eukprot:scaffold1594_cov171-Ochromonas_danica.AAC.27
MSGVAVVIERRRWFLGQREGSARATTVTRWRLSSSAKGRSEWSLLRCAAREVHSGVPHPMV